MKPIIEGILSFHFSSYEHLYEILETFSDKGLLNDKGKKVFKEVWRETTKKPDNYDKFYNIRNSWANFDDITKKYLIKEVDDMNSLAQEFINKQIKKG